MGIFRRNILIMLSMIASLWYQCPLMANDDISPAVQKAYVFDIESENRYQWIKKPLIETNVHRYFEELPASMTIPSGVNFLQLNGIEADSARVRQSSTDWYALAIFIVLFPFILATGGILLLISMVTVFGVLIGLCSLVTGRISEFCTQVNFEIHKMLARIRELSGRPLLVIASLPVAITIGYIAFVAISDLVTTDSEDRETFQSFDWPHAGKEATTLWIDNGRNFPIRLVYFTEDDREFYSIVRPYSILELMVPVGKLSFDMLREQDQTPLQSVTLDLTPSLRESNFIYNIGALNRYKMTVKLYQSKIEKIASQSQGSVSIR